MGLIFLLFDIALFLEVPFSYHSMYDACIMDSHLSSFVLQCFLLIMQGIDLRQALHAIFYVSTVFKFLVLFCICNTV